MKTDFLKNQVNSIVSLSNEDMSQYGIRALSRIHGEHPYILYVSGNGYNVTYLPGDSDSKSEGDILLRSSELQKP